MGADRTAARGERALLARWLRDRRQRMTRPRQTVLEVFLGMEGHVTADELLDAARRVDPGIGQATVFRTIKLFADAGIAREASAADGGRHYEHAFEHAHHDHLVCVRCGEVREFKDDVLERIQQRIYERHGYTPSGHRLELRGVCPSCAKAQRTKQPPPSARREGASWGKNGLSST